MSEKVTIGNAVLYHGDCMDILPTLPKVDAVVTDPPYGASTHDNAKSNAGGKGAIKAIDFKAIDFKAIETTIRALGFLCDGWLIANMEWQHIAALESADVPFDLVRFGVWVKTNPMPQIRGDRPAHGWDGIAYLYPKGKKKRWNGGGAHGNWIGPVVTDGAHPTGKPIAMVSQWVERFTDAQQLILDPFMGSGTTGVACAKLGRAFIGIERERKYFDIACERIAAAQAQGDLFGGAA